MAPVSANPKKRRNDGGNIARVEPPVKTTQSQQPKRKGRPQRVRPVQDTPTEIVQDSQDVENTFFQNMVKEVLLEMGLDYRWQGNALAALQLAAEAYTQGLIEDSHVLTLHTGRVTLMKKDMKLAMYFRGGL